MYIIFAPHCISQHGKLTAVGRVSEAARRVLIEKRPGLQYLVRNPYTVFPIILIVTPYKSL